MDKSYPQTLQAFRQNIASTYYKGRQLGPCVASARGEFHPPVQLRHRIVKCEVATFAPLTAT